MRIFKATILCKKTEVMKMMYSLFSSKGLFKEKLKENLNKRSELQFLRNKQQKFLKN